MNYKAIEIFTGEGARWHGKPPHEAVIGVLRQRKLAARCIVTRGLAGCYENGEVATPRIEILSVNMPLKIEVILPSSQADPLISALQELMPEGILGVRELDVVSHKTHKGLLPGHLLVCDIMTRDPQTVQPGTPAIDVVRMLLSADFNGVPVVDDASRPVGVITQGDLIMRAGMPVRLGLLAAMHPDNKNALLQGLQARTAGEIMTSPAVTVEEDRSLVDAVGLMVSRNLKRLPVVDARGRLTGILARWDVFRTITEETPDWKAISTQKIVLTDMKTVGGIMRRDTHTVPVTATLDEVMRVIDGNDLQRVAVVDGAGALLGMITDHSLLGLFAGQKIGVWERIANRLTFSEMGSRRTAVMEQAQRQTAGEVMKTDLVTVREETPVEEAVRLMAAHQIKRLPVVGDGGVFKGMVSRDSLLRAGMEDA